MTPMRTATLVTVSVLMLASGLLRLSFAQDLKRLRYGVSPATGHLPIWAAKEGGIFSKYGLDVEVILMRGGPLNTLAIVSGQMQLSSAGAESVASLPAPAFGRVSTVSTDATTSTIAVTTRSLLPISLKIAMNWMEMAIAWAMSASAMARMPATCRPSSCTVGDRTQAAYAMNSAPRVHTKS